MPYTSTPLSKLINKPSSSVSRTIQPCKNHHATEMNSSGLRNTCNQVMEEAEALTKTDIFNKPELKQHETGVDTISSATPSTSSGQRKRKKIEDMNKNVSSTMSVAKSIVEKLDRGRNARSANSVFSEYICAELEGLPKNEAKKKRQKILNVLFEGSN